MMETIDDLKVDEIDIKNEMNENQLAQITAVDAQTSEKSKTIKKGLHRAKWITRPTLVLNKQWKNP